MSTANGIKDGMKNIDKQVATWMSFKYAESGDIEMFTLCTPKQKRRKIRAIINHRIPGMAFDKDGHSIQYGGGSLQDIGGARIYNGEELSAFSLKFLRSIAEKYEIATEGKNSTALVDEIKAAQLKIMSAFAENDPTLS